MPGRRSEPQRAGTAFQAAQQLGQQRGQFVTTVGSQAREDGPFVGELLGQQSVHEIASGVGQTDVGDPAVPGVAAAFHQSAFGELFEPFGDRRSGGEGLCIRSGFLFPFPEHAAFCTGGSLCVTMFFRKELDFEE